MLIILFSTIAVIIAFFLKTNEYNKLVLEDKKIKERINEYNKIKDEIIEYANMKEIYNSYFNSLLNYPLIFKTIENYIPKEANRNNLRINNNNGNVVASISTEIK